MLIAHRSSWAAIFCHPECSKASVTSYNDRAFIISVPEWGFYEEQFRVAYRYKTFRHSLRLTKMLLSKQQCQPTVCPLQSKAFEWLRLIEWIIYGVSGPVWPAGSRHHEFTLAALTLGWRDPNSSDASNRCCSSLAKILSIVLAKVFFSCGIFLN